MIEHLTEEELENARRARKLAIRWFRMRNSPDGMRFRRYFRDNVRHFVQVARDPKGRPLFDESPEALRS